MTYKFGRIGKRRAADSLRGMTPYEPVAGQPGVPLCPEGQQLGPKGDKCVPSGDEPTGPGTIVLRPPTPKESGAALPQGISGRRRGRGRRGRRGRH